MKLPENIFSGYWKEGHVQGIAVDEEKGYIYFSFTTILLKTDLQGNPVGSVKRLAGHLGCITFDPDRRRVYGSLELKHDAIGAGIIARTGWDPSSEDAFYLVSFDVDKIDRMEMDAENDGVMQAVYLADVTDDYKAMDDNGCKHRYGCSGCDGTAYGPVFGQAADSPKKIFLAYGIYSETGREDNDYQVIHQYDPAMFEQYGKPLCQEDPHHSGPDHSQQRYFLFTGNTRYGIQNLEYDAYSRNYLVAVYEGEKDTYTNFPMFFIDATVAAEEKLLAGRGEEKGMVLTLANLGEEGKHGLYGTWFPLGSTGVYSMGDGRFYFSTPLHNREERIFASQVDIYRMDKGTKEVFVK